jgi:selenide, water dikinase
MADWQRKLLADPQTSGGLMVACAPTVAEEVLAIFHASGFAAAARIGTMRAGPSQVIVK